MINNDVILEKLKGFENLINEKFDGNDKDHKYLKDSLDKKAGKWTERAIITLMTGSAIWVLNQILNLIPKVQALIN